MESSLLSVFIYCFPMKKKNQETLYIGLKFDFICKFYGSRYSAMHNLQYCVPFSLKELYLEVYLSAN